MKALLQLALVLVLVGSGGVSRATQPVGVYAIVEKVLLEPAEGPPERIQVWGVFSIAKDRREAYEAAARGHLYFELKPGKEDACRKEWADLKKTAGMGKCLAFGNRYEQRIKLRKVEEKAENPDRYTISIGMKEVSTDTDYPPIKDLLRLSLAISPAEGEEVKPGRVQLCIHEPLYQDAGKEHNDARVFFELADSSGKKVSSPPLTPGKKETSWTPELEVKAGEKYTWRVWLASSDWKGPVRSATFKGTSKKDG